MADIGKVTPGSRIVPRVPQDDRPGKRHPEEEQQDEKGQDENEPEEKNENEDKEGGIDVYV